MMNIPAKHAVGFVRNVLARNHRFSYTVRYGLNKAKPTVLGIMRMRNESLILQDTLDSIEAHVDAVIIFDDSSSDDSVDIALAHPLVKEVICNKHWHSDRVWEETANRRLLLKRAKSYSPDWLFYFDADERYEGNIKEYLTTTEGSKPSGVRISLFDAYMTPSDKNPYEKEKKLLNYRKYFGVERRDILMIWRNARGVNYVLPDSREPTGIEGTVETKFFCQHYGKALSEEQWEENCDYYEKNFPAYSEKWAKRHGKAIHTVSDFGTELELWSDAKKSTHKI